MERAELVRRLVLNEICDDYENVDQVIFPRIEEQGAKLGLDVERHEILGALEELILQGLAAAYILSCTQPAKELPGMPSLDAVEEGFETYFYATKRGIELQLSDGAWWPFDEEDEECAPPAGD